MPLGSRFGLSDVVADNATGNSSETKVKVETRITKFLQDGKC